VKKVLGLFGSGREEDRLTGYLSFLKIGPQLLKFIPGRKARDLKSWLTVYGYWNQVRGQAAQPQLQRYTRIALPSCDVAVSGAGTAVRTAETAA
jgi:hypothetical protein